MPTAPRLRAFVTAKRGNVQGRSSDSNVKGAVYRRSLAAWGVLGISMLAAFGAWYAAESYVAKRDQARFEVEAYRIREALLDRILRCRDTLNAAQALQAATHGIEAATLARWFGTIGLERTLPEIQSITYFPRTKEGGFQLIPDERLTLWKHPSVDTTRDPWANAAAWTALAQAAADAFTAGAFRLTSAIEGSGGTESEAVLAMVISIDSDGADAAALARGEALQGWLVASLRISEMVRRIDEADPSDVRLSSLAGIELSPYASSEASAQPTAFTEPQTSYGLTLDVAGRSLPATFVSTRRSVWHFADDYPLQVLIGGLAMSVLLFDIALMMALTRSKALAISELMTRRLRESEARVQSVVDYAPEGIVTFEADGSVASFNPGAERIFGYSEEQAKEKPIQKLMQGWSLQEILQPRRGADAERGAPESREVVGVRGDGERFPTELTISQMNFGDPPLWTAIVRDISERKRTEEALRRSEQRYALAASAANDGLWDWDLKTDEVYYSPRWKAALGYAGHEIGSSSSEARDRIHAEDRPHFEQVLWQHLQGRTPHFEAEYRMRHRDGTYRWMLGRGVSVRDKDGQAVRIAGSQADITSRKEAEIKLLHEVLHDSLTGLPNRAHFLKELDRLITEKNQTDRDFALMFLDLDYFKHINDSLGHHVGDQFLVAVTGRIKSILRPSDMLARVGGDEFAIAVQDVKQVADVTHIADRVQEALSHVIVAGGTEILVTVSIGITMVTQKGKTADGLIREADTAMYRAKATGKGRRKVFDSTLQAQSLQRISCERMLRQALPRGELFVHYQPIVSLETGRISACEALVRWQHPERGMVLPGEFIPVAEESGLINPIGEWVLQQACRQVVAWNRENPTDIRMAVNVSLRQCAFGNLSGVVGRILKETGLEPGSLQLEITESSLMENPDDLLEQMIELYAKGVQFSLDDYGTGYSSLTYVRRLPVRTLKIGESSAREVVADPEGAALASGLISLGRNLGLQVIGEGVETVKQLDFFQSEGCHEVQGHLFSRAVDPAAFAELLASDEQEPLLTQVLHRSRTRLGSRAGVSRL